jgi:hypothetical protein
MAFHNRLVLYSDDREHRVSNDALAIAGCAAMLIGTAWMSRVSINTAYLGGAVGLGILITVFDAAGNGAHAPREILSDRVSAALTAGTVFLILALAVTLLARPRASSSPIEHCGETSLQPAPDPAANRAAAA